MAGFPPNTAARSSCRPLAWITLVVGCVLLLSACNNDPQLGAPAQGSIAAGSTLDYDYDPANGWGLEGLDHGSGNNNFVSQGLAMAQLGDYLYVGGKFLELSNGTETISQPFLAAFDARTGNPIPSFAPTIDWPVFVIEPSPDGSRLFVGGDFTDAGAPNTGGIVALDPLTGAVDTGWDGHVAWPGSQNPRVWAIEIVGNDMYVGGAFTEVSGGGTTHVVKNLARLDLATGHPDTTWDALIDDGAVWAIEGSIDGTQLYIGGLFKIVNGVDQRAAATLNTSDAQLTTGVWQILGNWFTNPPDPNFEYVSDIEAVGDKVFWGGQAHHLLVTNASNLNVVRVYKTNQYGAPPGNAGGDIQALAVADGVLFATCHCWGQVRDAINNEYHNVRSVFAIDTDTGDFHPEYAPDMNGTAGAWAAHVSPDNCVWLAGQYTKSNGVNVDNLVRHCPNPLDANTPTQPVSCTTHATAAGEIAVTITRSANDNVQTFRLERSRNGGVWWFLDDIEVLAATTAEDFVVHLDSGMQNDVYEYRVISEKGANSTAPFLCGPPTLVGPNAPLQPASCIATDTGTNAVDIAWVPTAGDNAQNYIVERLTFAGWVPAATVAAPATAATDPSVPAGITAYRVATEANGVSTLATSCTPLPLVVAAGPPVAVVDCLATDLGGGDIEITWTPAANDNATDYLVESSTDAGVTYNPLATVTAPGTTHTEPAMAPGTYNFQVTTTDGTTNATPTTCDPADLVIPPGPPVAVVDCLATDLGGGDIEITWTPAANDNATDYLVESSTDAGVTYNPLATVTAPGTTHTEPAMAPGTYNFQVTTTDGTTNAIPTTCDPAAGITIP